MHYKTSVIIKENSIEKAKEYIEKYCYYSGEEDNEDLCLERTKKEIIDMAKNMKDLYNDNYSQGFALSEANLKFINSNTDDELYEAWVYAHRYEGYKYDAEGNQYSNNFDSKKDKFDYCLIDNKKIKENDQYKEICRISDISNIDEIKKDLFAILCDNEWIDMYDYKHDYVIKKFDEIVELKKDWYMIVFDCHQ